MGIKNKRAWMRILEATISILILAGVMVTIYSGGGEVSTTSRSESIHRLQSQILDDIVSSDVLRGHVLGDNETDLVILEDYVNERIPESMGSSLMVCDLADPCNLNSTLFLETYSLESFVEEKIVSSNFSDYKPRKVKLFLWIKE